MLLLLITFDPALSRLDPMLLSDQALMEMTIENLTERSREKFTDRHGNYKDVCRWRGVHCDAHDNVIRIHIDHFFRSFEGTIKLSFLPSHLKELEIVGHECTGTIDTSLLPQSLEWLTLSGNKRFSGTFDLTTLPEGLCEALVPSNNFCGRCDLSALPSTLITLDVSGNAFTGSVSLDSLPKGIRKIQMADNKLHGSLHFDKIPASLYSLNLANNNFSGDLDFSKIPTGINKLYLNSNQFSGELRALPIPKGLWDIDLSDNLLSGTAVVMKTSRMQKVRLQNNPIVAILDENGERYGEKDTKRMLREGQYRR